MLKKAIIKSATFLDIKHELGEYHGNYQSARKPNAVIEYMLKSIQIKTDPNLYYSEGMSDLIGELANSKTLSESLLDLAEIEEILQAMNFLRKEDPDMYLKQGTKKQGTKIEKRLIEVYKDKYLQSQSGYDIDKFYISADMCKSIKKYMVRKQQGENPVLVIVNGARYR